MSDLMQVAVVTVVALAALIVLIRPLVARGKGPGRPSGGCESCGAADAPRRPGGSRGAPGH